MRLRVFLVRPIFTTGKKTLECSKLSHKINGADENWKRIVPRAIFFPCIYDAGKRGNKNSLHTLFIAMRFLVHSWDFCAFLMGIKG